ncbi:helix-turn-helix transcriptional regulator [Actinomadura algeriensis]|uniref:ArsR family transcriptional regulator n=1 Tax=Actinomadura algeriensis TaxID=1679523 RepID=A0ABR9K071_9ACTN|nr:transcriptional regulator [Actinomadura algeriensis]MBE1536228.1 putative ArsR family transcriptional regulator [Actinomadura algeriensis]
MEDIDAIALLQDPVRRRLYEFVAALGREAGRNEAAEAAGVSRTLAAFHLDKLVDAGLLEAGSRRLTGRSGPGAGRPAKVYRRSAAERGVSVPARDYGTAAVLLAEAAEAAGLDVELRDAARRRGRSLAAADGPCGGLAEFEGMLARRGYEPVRECEESRGECGPGEGGGAVVRMRNCPFHVVAEAFPPLVCGMNLALLEGLAEGGGRVRVRMDARPGWCCVVAEEAGSAPPSKNNED